MKNINLNNTKDLISLKEAFIKSIDERIESSKLRDSMSSMDNQPLGVLNAIFESVSDKLFSTKNGKNVIKNYVNTLKESKNLKWEYYVCKMLNGKYGINNPSSVINEAVKMSSDINRSQFKKEKEKVASIVREAIKVSGMKNDELCSIIENNRSINEDIEYVMTKKKTTSNISEYVGKLNTITEEMSKKELKESYGDELDSKELMSKLLENGNNGSEKWQKEAISEISLSYLNGSGCEGVFESYKNECLDELKTLIEESDSVEDISRFTKMSEQLNEKKYSEETSIDDILKLSELKEMLSNE